MLRRVLLGCIAALATVGIAKTVRSEILYPCGCSEYYVKQCTSCPQGLVCAEEHCSRTKTWQNASCKQHKDPGTCNVSTDQPGFDNTYEFWTCESGSTCHCPTADPDVTTTPTKVSILANGTTACPALQCNQNRDCIPQ